MKKPSAAAAVFTAAVGILAAVFCIWDRPHDTENAPVSSPDTVLHVMHCSTAPDYQETYEELAKEYNQNNPYHVTIQFEFYTSDELKLKLKSLMASNADMDIFLTWEHTFLEPYVNAGKILDLTPYLEKDPEWSSRFDPGTLDLLTYHGRVYAIPTQKTAAVVFYNKEIFEKAGVSVPNTYKEFLELCASLKRQGIVPLSMNGTMSWSFAQFFQQILISTSGLSIYNGICDGSIPWDCEEMVRAGEELQKMAAAGYFQTTIRGTDLHLPFPSYDTGETAMYYQPQWICGTIEESAVGDVTGTFAFPGTTPENSRISLGSIDTSFAVAKTCSNPEAAVDFLKFMTSSTATEKLLYEEQRIPATNMEIRSEQIPSVLADSLKVSSGFTALTPWFDRMVNSSVGAEFNSACLAISTGADVRETLTALQHYAEKYQNQEELP